MKNKKEEYLIKSPLYIIGFLITAILYLNIDNIRRVLSGFSLQEYELLRKYIETLFSLPIVILILGLIFIFKFGSSISKFLENNNLSNAGPFGFTQQQQPSKDVRKELKGIVKEGKSKPESWEFAYLNLALVQNSKIALFWFISGSTKENFMANYFVPDTVPNKEAEKEAIFNVLLSNKLISEIDGIYKTSEKGKRFLMFLNYKIPD